MLHKKKVYWTLAVVFCLTIGVSSAYSDKGDWLQLIENTDHCIDCHTIYKICKVETPTLDKQAFDLSWRNTQLTPLIDISNKVSDFTISQLKDTSYTHQYIYICSHDFQYDDKTKEAWCWDTKLSPNGTKNLINYIPHYDFIDIPSKTAGWNEYIPQSEWIPYEKTQIKDELLSKEDGSCETIKISGKLKPGEVIDHYISWAGYDYTEYAWWNATFLNKKEITITNNNDTWLNDFVVPINIDLSSMTLLPACEDIRFTNETESGELDYYIEPNTCDLYGNTTIFVEVDDIKPSTTTTIYIYYNAPTASSKYSNSSQSGTETFPCFVDGTNLGDLTVGGSATVSNNVTYMHLEATQDDVYLSCAYTDNFYFEYKFIDYGSIKASEQLRGDASNRHAHFATDGAVGTVEWRMLYGATLWSVDSKSLRSKWYGVTYLIDRENADQTGDLYNTSFDEPYNSRTHYWSGLTGSAFYGSPTDLSQIFFRDYDKTRKEYAYVFIRPYVINQPFVSNIGAEESGGETIAIEFNHTELNQSINYADINITLDSSINMSECNITLDGLTFALGIFNNTRFYYLASFAEGNHTYWANCSNGTVLANTTLGWTYVDLPLNLTWDWDFINTTIGTQTSHVYANATNADNCTLSFNGTNYTMSEPSADHWYYKLTGLTNGNYSSINVTCENLDDINITSTGWLNVSYTAGAIVEGGGNFSVKYYCPPLAFVDTPFVVWAEVKNQSDNVPITTATVTAVNTTDEYAMAYNSTAQDYREYFISTEPYVWRYNISVKATGFNFTNYSCETTIVTPFQLAVRIWEEVELRTYANTSEYIVTVKNYDKALTDPYINEFGYVIAKSNGLNATGAYTYCNFPLGSAQGIMDVVNIGNWMGDSITNLTTHYVGEYIGCDDFWFRAEYSNGRANLTLPYAGNYSLYFVDGTILWENQFSPPQIVKSDLFLYLGEITIPYNASWLQDYYVTHEELDYWGALTDSLFVFLVTVLPIIFFIALVMLGVPIKFAGGLVLMWDVVWIILRMLK